MNTTYAGEETVQTFADILEVSRRGPQCPCGIANEVGLAERDIYPYLAEMLAREWVVIIIPSESQGVHVANQSELLARHAATLSDVSKLSSDNHGNGLLDKTQAWYDFFKAIRPVGEGILYFIGVTDLGVQALKSIPRVLYAA